MKRIFILLSVVAPLSLISSARAGDYHTNGTLYCSQCHVMHFSQSHGYSPTGIGFFTPLGGTGPQEFLLRAPVNDLCLSCHDSNGFAPDVLGSNNLGNEPTDVRSAGYLNRIGLSGTDGQVATGHTLDSTAVAPGSNPAWSNAEGLECVDCHHQHGYNGGGAVPHPQGATGQNYRNLKANPGNGTARFVTYNYDGIGTNNLARDVYERQAANYDETQMDLNEPVQTASAIANWCAGCHSDFHGAVGGAQVGGVAGGGGFIDFIRHPAAGVNIGGQSAGGHSSLSQYNAHTAKVKVMSNIGAWNPGDASVTPTCITCHKAHGNGNAFGLIFRQGTGTLTENGDSVGNQLEDLCGQCHVQAAYFFQTP